MKKYLIIASAALFALAACNKEIENPAVDPFNDDTVILSFTSERPQIDVETKTVWDESTSSVCWTSSDKIKVGYTKDGAWQSKGDGKDTTPRLYTSQTVDLGGEETSNVGTFRVPVNSSSFTNPGTSASYQFFGLYPVSLVSSTAASNAPNVNITIPVSQLPLANSFDASADVLVGQTTAATITGIPTDAIAINWNRIVAHAFITFKSLPDVESDETVKEITLTAQSDANLVGNEVIDLTDGSYTAGTGGSNVTNIVRIQGTNLAFVTESEKTNLKAWVCVLPETITSLSVDIETNKAHYTRDITGISRTFKANAKNNLPINMASSTRTAKAGQLVADGYYVISYNDDQMMTVGTFANAYRGNTDKNTSNPSDDAIWGITYDSANDAYTIHSLEEDVDLYGATTDAPTLSLSSAPGLTNLFYIEKTSAEATTYKISPVGNSTRSIGYNIQSPRFALYTGGVNQPIALDLTAVTPDTSPRIEVTTPVNIAKTEISESTTITTITRKYFTGAISASSNQSWLTVSNLAVNETEVKVTAQANTGGERTAVITLSAEGIESKTISVVQASGVVPTKDAFIKITSNAELELGDDAEYLLIYVPSSGTPLAFNGSLDSPDASSGVEVTFDSDGDATYNTYKAYSISIYESATSGKYYVKTKSGKYIGRNANINGMDVATTPGANYNNGIAFNSTGAVTITGNGGRALCYYSGNSNYRYYASSNCKDMYLYKYVDTGITINPSATTVNGR